MDDWLGLVLAGMLVLTGAVLPLSLLAATMYTLTAKALCIRSGFFRWTIPLRDITGVERTQGPLSSPALSLDRLRIHHGSGRAVLISPRDPEAFLQDLHALGVPRD